MEGALFNICLFYYLTILVLAMSTIHETSSINSNVRVMPMTTQTQNGVGSFSSSTGSAIVVKVPVSLQGDKVISLRALTFQQY
jgi:hypothetical protein